MILKANQNYDNLLANLVSSSFQFALFAKSQFEIISLIHITRYRI